VLDGEPEELLRQLDEIVRDAAVAASAQPLVHRASQVVSDLTGPGLVGATVTGVLALLVVRRRRDALVVGLGTASAWLASALLKLVFSLPRPTLGPHEHLVTGYGFPSAHVFVAVVASGLLAWAAGEPASPRIRRALAIGVVLLTAGTSVARIVLAKHWATDVIGGLALGILWLNCGLLLASRHRSLAWGHAKVKA
jgi:membrane-associated phospholipid phosphatase